jgi:hypothetical protein
MFAHFCATEAKSKLNVLKRRDKKCALFEIATASQNAHFARKKTERNQG